MKKKAKRNLRKARRRLRGWRPPPPPPFEVEVEYKYFSYDLDIEIREAAGRIRSDGSGYMLPEQTRDLCFGFKKRDSAIAAAKRINKIRGVKAIVTGRVWP